MVFVTFDSRARGRTGNQIIQYLVCKVLELKLGHTYISYDLFDLDNNKEIFLYNDENIEDLLSNNNNIWDEIKDKHLIGEGYFQKSEYLMKDRNSLLEMVYNENNCDYWVFNNNKIFIKDFLFYKNNVDFNDNDLVISLRLDDFIQLPCKTSDLLPPSFYINILNSINFNKLYIVCDKITYQWEYDYLDFFKKWNPILIQGTILHDASIIRDCKNLIHSNSTFCWIMSFFSETKLQRFIPNTHFYSHQSLFKINDNDIIIDVNPLTHKEVLELHI